MVAENSAVWRPEFDHLGLDILPVVIRYATRRGNQRGLANIVAGLDEVFRATKGSKVRIALENTAGDCPRFRHAYVNVNVICNPHCRDGCIPPLSPAVHANFWNYPPPAMATPTYTISDLAKEFDLTTRAMRFYEDMGLLQPERGDASADALHLPGRRLFRPLDDDGLDRAPDVRVSVELGFGDQAL